MTTQSIPIYSLLTGQRVGFSFDPDNYINNHTNTYYYQHDTEDQLAELFFDSHGKTA